MSLFCIMKLFQGMDILISNILLCLWHEGVLFHYIYHTEFWPMWCYIVKPVLNGHSKEDKRKEFQDW